MARKTGTADAKTRPSGDEVVELEPPTSGGTRKHLVLTAEEDVTIRCGASSITLTAAGKIIIRGKYIVSRSSGVQRIKGGSVQIN